MRAHCTHARDRRTARVRYSSTPHFLYAIENNNRVSRIVIFVIDCLYIRTPYFEYAAAFVRIKIDERFARAQKVEELSIPLVARLPIVVAQAFDSIATIQRPVAIVSNQPEMIFVWRNLSIHKERIIYYLFAYQSNIEKINIHMNLIQYLKKENTL